MLPVPPLNVVTSSPVGGGLTALTTNATITTTRRGTNPLVAQRVQIKAPTTTPAIRAEGYVIETTLLLPPDADIIEGDAIHIDQMDGFTDLTKQEGYTAGRIVRLGGAFPQTRVTIDGTIQ